MREISNAAFSRKCAQLAAELHAEEVRRKNGSVRDLKILGTDKAVLVTYQIGGATYTARYPYYGGSDEQEKKATATD